MNAAAILGDASRSGHKSGGPALSVAEGIGLLLALCAALWFAAPAAADGLVLSSDRPGQTGPQIDVAVLSPRPDSQVGATAYSGGPAAAVLASAGQTYVVRPGDTLSEIAARFGMQPAVLAERNALKDPNHIEVGQVLQVESPRSLRLGLPRDGELARVRLWPWPPIQGQTLVVWLLARTPVTFSLDFAGESFPLTVEGRRGWAMIPIPALVAPGLKPLTVTAGRTVVTLPVQVKSGVFEQYEIPASASAPILSQTAKVRAEAARLGALFSIDSPFGWTPRSRFRGPLEGDFSHSSPYGSRRTYGGGSAISAHEGEDYGAPPGTPVRAPAAGVVALAEPLFVRGNAVVLDHGHGVFTGYWHLQKLDVGTGERVEPGQVLGEVGSTGLSTGAHLHWELRVNGIPVNPLQWLAR